MIVQCEVISVTGRNWQSTTLPQNSTTSTEKWAVTKWFSSFRKLLKHGEEEESCGCVKDATRFNKRWVVKSTLPFIFHFLTYVNVYNVHHTQHLSDCVCVCVFDIFIYKAPGSFPFSFTCAICRCHDQIMRQRDTLSPFGLPVFSTQLDTFHPEKGNDYLENLNEMKRTRVYRWVRFLHFEVYVWHSSCCFPFGGLGGLSLRL